MARIVLENISKNFGTVQAVKDFNLTVVDTQTTGRMHQEIELVFDLNKMHLFEKDSTNLRIKTEASQ